MSRSRQDGEHNDGMGMNMTIVSHRALCAALAPLVMAGGFGIPSIVLAQATQTAATPRVLPELKDGKRSFDAAYFNADNPKTAADMVDRVPGFGIQDGDSVRGFGGAAGNVLIDGARPTSKDESLQSILSRIPAANVERIELLEGNAAAALAPGKAQVVNVVRKADAKSGGSFEVQTTVISSGRIVPSLKASYTARVGQFNVTVGVDGGVREREDLVGYEGILTPNGTYLERGPNDDRRRYAEGQVTLAADASFGAYKLNTNATVFRNDFRRNAVAIAIRTGQTQPFRVDDITERSGANGWEVGGDVEREIIGWTSKLALLAKSETSTNLSLAGFNLVGTPNSFDRFISDDTTVERVARATFKRKIGSHQVEAGGEFAYNSLDTTGVFSQGNGTNFVVQQSDISSTQVAENRREAFVSDSWTLSPRWTLDATLTGEWSTISQSGDAAKERSFFYPKPRARLAFKPNEKTSIRLGIAREVGQLDFGAFADSASVGDGNQNSGNPELRPEQSWAYRIGFERRWGDRGVVDFGIVYKQIEDQLSLVPTRGGGVALGNIPEATLIGYSLSWTLPLDAFAKGLEVGGSYRWRDTELIDPLTGTARPFSGSNGNQFNANVRYDLPAKKLKFGAWLWRGEHRREYRPTQQFEWSTIENWGAWVETSAFKGFTAEFGFENPQGTSFSRVRTDYVPNRRAGIVGQTQYRERNSNGTWYLLFKGTI
jgi:outer membrane receptor protein involved in Fe transport